MKKNQENNDRKENQKKTEQDLAGSAIRQTGENVPQPEQPVDEQTKQEYQDYIKEMTPTHNLWIQMGKAFLTGGVICMLGQGILNYCTGSLGLPQEEAGSWCSLILILSSILLTGWNIYPSIVKFGGAGALVPITGFANSVSAPAIEFQREGQVFGIGCKIFTIAGPVILYGIFSSWILGLIYWIGTLMGVV